MSDRRRGFTLLELVLAMTALALVTGICYGAFHLAMRAMERGEVAVVTAQRLRVTSDVLRQIRSALYHVDRSSEDPDQTCSYFQGSATSLSFDTSMQLQGGGGVSRVTYQVLDNPTRLVLTESAVPPHTRRHRGHREDAEPLTFNRSTVLLEGFQSLQFSYIDVSGADASSWNPCHEDLDQEGLPLAVRIVIEGVPGIETGRWGQEIPVSLVAMNEAVVEGGSDELADSLNNEVEDDEDDEEDDDAATTPRKPGSARMRHSTEDDE
jgi:prepilin-type N-terminal cleavage/methylation domain-containing protein